MITLFRAVVVISTIIAAVGYALPHIGTGLYSPEVNDLRAWDGYNSVLPYNVVLDVGLMLAGLVLPVFLYFFVWWARRAYLIFLLVLIVTTFLWGVRVTTPLEMAIWYVVALADGAILTMAYLTSAAARFERLAAQQAVPADGPASRARG